MHQEPCAAVQRRTRGTRRAWGLSACCALSALIVGGACSSTSAQQTRRPAPTEVVATVGSTPITLAEVDDKALEQTSPGGVKLSQALYEARRATLDDLIASRLMDDAAKNQGIERSALIEKEITAKVQTVTEGEIAAWYQANQGRVQGAPLDQVRQAIKSYLTQQRMQDVREQYLDTLKKKTTVRVMLDPPRQTVAPANVPSNGSANAPIDMIERSAFPHP